MWLSFCCQVWAVNSAGHTESPWANGRTGPAPPEDVGPPVFKRISATSAVVDIHPPARPNGIVSLYRVFSLNHNNLTLVHLIIYFMLWFPFLWLSLCYCFFFPLWSTHFLSWYCSNLWCELTSLSSSCSSQRAHPISRHSMVCVLTPSIM